MNRPITSIWTRWSGWKNGWRDIAARCCWFRTTATFSTAASLISPTFTRSSSRFIPATIRRSKSCAPPSWRCSRRCTRSSSVKSRISKATSSASAPRRPRRARRRAGSRRSIAWSASARRTSMRRSISSFPSPRAPDPLLVLEQAAAGYAGRAVLDDLQLTLRPGARIGLLGPNGAGKSTLIKLLAGEIAPVSGKRIEGRGLAIGYFAQHQLEQLRPEESPLWHMVRQEPRTKEQSLRDYLGGFDFRGAMADAAIAPFSGGEKSRLALALLVRRRPNLLLLDEPTNHLDLEMRHALTRALAQYEGSLVLVSHDRALLRTVCDEFLIVADGRAHSFDGDLDDYMAWLNARRADRGGSPQADAGKTSRKQARANALADRQSRLARRRALTKETSALDRKLAAWQEELRTLDAQLADVQFSAGADPAKLADCAKRHAALAHLIEDAEHRWLQAHGELEEIGEE